MKRALILFFNFLIIAFLLSPAAARADAPAGLGAKRGWWWYEKPPVKPEKKKAPVQKTPFVPSLKDYTMQQLWDMHPDQFRPLLKAFLEKAVQDPTVENVKEYYTVLDIARRKALAFTNVAAYVWQKYPDLSTAKDYPVAAPGQNAMHREQYGEIDSTIENARNDFALLYFYQPG